MQWTRLCLCTCVLVVAVACGDDGPTSESGAAGTDTSSGESGSGSGASEGDSTAATEPGGMTFFVSSEGSGARGGNWGGLAGADAFCQELAAAAGVGEHTWHAYLSTTTEDARDRIGPGPWYDFAGDMIAADVASLHADGLSNGDPQHVLTEYGEEVPFSDDYDIITGSNEDGTVYEERHCNDWTSDSADFRARYGRSAVPSDPENSPSWNSAGSTNGCGEADFMEDACRGRIYCFAID